MESNGKITDILEKILKLLEDSEEREWLSFFSYILSKIIIEDDEITVCREILIVFQGGMGSFNDLVLHKNGLPLITENNELDKLKDQLFDYCYDIVHHL